MPNRSALVVDGLVKKDLAARLRSQIVSGAIPPGTRIVEGSWARKFGVAQGSIREALNLLVQEGFVTKDAGRSARVVYLSEDDVGWIYDVRGALEGLAARVAANANSNLGVLQASLDDMRRAVKSGDEEGLLQSDLRFHLELIKLSGNPYLIDQAQRILLPLFAFVRIRTISSQQGTSPWSKVLSVHQRIIDLVDEGDGDLAEKYVKNVMARLAKNAYVSWGEAGHGR